MSVNSKKESVKSFFEKPELYLGDKEISIGIASRIGVISAMLEGESYKRVLDAPCGNGVISREISSFGEDFTLVDISSGMIELAKVNTNDQKSKFSIIEGDIMELEFEEKFDLILAIGILAHVDDPQAFIGKIDTLLAKGGTLIIQNTDDNHFKIKMNKWLNKNSKLTQGGYDLNEISQKWVLKTLEDLSYELEEEYRYDTRTSLRKGRENLNKIWKIFGNPPRNSSLGFLGSKVICKFKKSE